MIGEDLDLAERFPQRVTVITISRKAAHADDEALIQRDSDADLSAELVEQMPQPQTS